MQRAYVTGTNGFIGFHLVSLLLERGFEVVGLVRTTSDTRRLRGLSWRFPDRFRLVIGDLREPETLRAGLKDVDYVFHAGAVIMGTSEKEFRETIVDGTRNLLEAVRDAKTDRLKRFVHVSSMAAAGPSPTERPLTEADERRPVSWYGRAKRDSEDLVLEAGRSGLPVSILRPSAVFGETETDLARGSFPAIQAGLLPQIGFGKRLAGFVYVGDVAAALLQAAETDQTLGKSYFLCYEKPQRPRDFARAAADGLGTRVRIPVSIPAFLLVGMAIFAELKRIFLGGRPLITRDKVREVRQRYWACSPQAARADFGWTPQVSLEEGVAREARDWLERKRRGHPAFHEPRSRRAIKTYALTFVIGMLIDVICVGFRWYRFHTPGGPVLEWVGLGVYWSIVMGSVAFFTARLSKLWQLLIGTAVFAATELSNALWLHLWTFDPEGPLGAIPGPWLRAGVLGLAVGLLTVVVPNSIVGALYRHRLRTG